MGWVLAAWLHLPGLPNKANRFRRLYPAGPLCFPSALCYGLYHTYFQNKPKELKIKGRDVKALNRRRVVLSTGSPSSGGQTLRGGYRCYCYFSRAQDSEEGTSANPSWGRSLCSAGGSLAKVWRLTPLSNRACPSSAPYTSSSTGPAAPLHRFLPNDAPALRYHASSDGPGASPHRQRSAHRWHSRRRRPGCGSCGG